MSISFSELVTFYRKLSSLGDDKIAVYKINTTNDLNLITKVLGCFTQTQIRKVSGNSELKQELLLEINHPDLSIGRFYKSFTDYIKGDFVSIHKSKLNNSEFYIFEDKYFDIEGIKLEKVESYKCVKKLFQCLNEMSTYSDQTRKKLVFFSKRVIKVDYNINNIITELESSIKSLTLESRELIVDFCSWFSDENSKTHIDEKKVILSQVLQNLNEKKSEITLVDVINNLELILKGIEGQFALYIENFKYDKYVEKLEEQSEKFIDHVNNSISKVVNQVLGLPIAIAVSAVIRGSQNDGFWIVYIVVIAYSLICFVALLAQKSSLDHINNSVNNYDKKLPQYFNKKWTDEKKQIKRLICSQIWLFWIMMSVIVSAFLYSIYNLVIFFHCS